MAGCRAAGRDLLPLRVEPPAGRQGSAGRRGLVLFSGYATDQGELFVLQRICWRELTRLGSSTDMGCQFIQVGSIQHHSDGSGSLNLSLSHWNCSSGRSGPYLQS